MNLCHLIGAMKGTVKPELTPGDMLLGVDGGLVQIQQWGLTPHHIVGDFDSLGYVPQGEDISLLPVRKDLTDMEFALHYGLEQGFRHFLLQGGLGGRLDHSYANLQLLHQLEKKGGRGILLGDGHNAMVISAGKVVFPPEFHGYCSVFALTPQAKGVDLSGLSYEGGGYTLKNDTPLGVSNEFIQGKSAQISVAEGALLVIWHGVWTEAQYRSILS